MTSEGPKPTEAWAQKNECRTGYAYDKKGALGRFFGVRGIPHAVLVDPGGTVVWSGHPGALDGSTIEKALSGALPTPIFEWPEEAKRVRKELLDGDLAKALAEAGEVGQAYVDIVQTRIDSVRDGVVQAHQAGDYLAAVRLGERAEKQLDDLPELEAVKEVLRKIDEDAEAKRILGLQEDVADLLEKGRELTSRKKVGDVIQDLRELVSEHSGTIVETQARVAIEELQARIGR